MTAGKPLFGATDYVEWADTFSKTFSEKDLPAVRSGKTAEAAIVMPAAEARLRQKKIALDEIIPLAERAEQSADAQRAAREEITRIMPEREAPAVQIAPTITSTWSSSYLSPALTRAAGYASAIGLYGVGTTLSNAASAASAATTETSATLLTALSHASTDPATLGVAILTAATAIAWTPLRNAATAFLKPTAETIAEGLESPMKRCDKQRKTNSPRWGMWAHVPRQKNSRAKTRRQESKPTNSSCNSDKLQTEQNSK